MTATTAAAVMDGPFVRVPPVHVDRPAGPAIPCEQRCVTCRVFREHCPAGAITRRCAPVCDHNARRPAPVPICIVVTRARARLVVRENPSRTTHIGPTGNVYPPPPILWPLLVVDVCPHCAATHWHTIQDPGPAWFRRPICGRPYLVTLITPPSSTPTSTWRTA